MRKIFLFIILFPLLISCTQKKPNIVFILVDDLGWTDLGYTGSSFYESPNIDMLSKESIQFDNAYSAASVCSPARAAIMTGKHPARVNITDWIPGNDPKDEMLLGPEDANELPLEEFTIAEALKEQGYQTFFAGKWHLGGEGFLPTDQGFDKNKGGYDIGQPPHGYYSPYQNPKLSDGPKGEYLTDRLTNESIQFIDQHKDESFFLFLSFYSVHAPIQACKRHIDKFKNKLSSMSNQKIHQRKEGKGITTLDQKNPAYASMVYAVDENIGRLIDKLKEENLYENTIIIFTSDNGSLTTVKSEYHWVAPSAVVPLRAGKGWLYEGGIRVPLLIKPDNSHKSRICSSPVVSYDFYPTILSLLGVNNTTEQHIDGCDISPLLDGESTLNREEVFWHYPHYHGSAWTPGAAIRQSDWKLIEFYETGKTELYHLSDDISENNDLSSKYPEKVLEMQNRLHQLQTSMHANKAILNPNYQKE